LVARELTHEYLNTFNAILNEYRLDLGRLFAGDPRVPGSMRADMMRLSDMIPTMRVAADMKLEVFRNPQRKWTVNMMHDIDALSLAVPYCHVVVPDKDAADLLRRSRAHTRHGTRVLTRLVELCPIVEELAAGVHQANRSGWDHVGPEAPFCATEADLPPSIRRHSGPTW
jgi:hypothetical protein